MFMPGPATAETPVAGSYAGGNGTQGSPYQISTLAELRLLSETEADWVADTYFILTADIDATDTNTWNIGDHDGKAGTAVEAMGFSPIGNSTQATKFFGVVNGQDYVISNLTINRPGYDYIGFFGYTGYPANISNLGIEGGTVEGGNYTGGLAGLKRGTITSCHASASVVGGAQVGGLVGSNYGNTTSSHVTGTVRGKDSVGGLLGSNAGTITSCYTTGDVSGGTQVGGLIGVGNSSIIEFSYAIGDVSGIGGAIGGLIGSGGLTITSCYATGDVSGGVHVGGLAGESGHSSIIEFSYATGEVSGAGICTGGLVGHNNAHVTECHATGAVSGDDWVGGLVGHNLHSSDNLITFCFATGTVVGRNEVGGFVGNNYNAITSSYATGAVTATGSNVGGFAGYSEDTITSCYATGPVSATMMVGGFVGYNSSGDIISSYATGAVIATGDNIGGFVGYNSSGDIISSYATGAATTTGGNVGGFAGSNQNGTIYSCYWDLNTSGHITSDGGTGLTSSQMQLQASYDENWDFETNPDWVIIEGETRPYFPWQIPALFEGPAIFTGTEFTLTNGYVHNVAGSGVILDEYGIVYHEDESDDLIYYDLTDTPLDETEAVTLDGVIIDELLDDITYWYRAYAVDSDGTIHYGTERRAKTVEVPIVYYWPTAAGISYGQFLVDATLFGGSASVPGTFTFESPSTVPNAGTNSYAVTFTPTDINNYGIVSGMVSVTVAKATPVILTAPTASDIKYGQALTDSHLSGGAGSVPGTFSFDEPRTAPYLGTASHNVIFTPTDSTNYDTASTSVYVTVTPDTAIYVDFIKGRPLGAGTSVDPVDSIDSALLLVPANGTIKIYPNTTTQIITIDQPVIVVRWFQRVRTNR